MQWYALVRGTVGSGG